MEILETFRQAGVISQEEKHLLEISLINNRQGLVAVLDGIEKSENATGALNIFRLVGALAKCCFEEERKLEFVNVHGNLSKLPMSKRSKGWKSRYFKLDSHILSYYAKSGDAKAKGQMAVTPESFIRDVDVPGMEFCFEIVSSRGALCLGAETAKEKHAWVGALSRVIHSARAPASCGPRKEGGEENVEGKVVDTKMGFMEKQPVNSRRSGVWKRRYFVLYKNLLSYYEQEGDSRPKGDFLLDPSCAVVLGLPQGEPRKKSLFGLSSKSKDKNEFTFHINAESKSLVLRCTSQEELTEWTDVLEGAISLSKECIEQNEEKHLSFRQNDPLSKLVESQYPVSCATSFDKLEEFEVIITDHEVNTATSIGVVTISSNTYLSCLRDNIRQQIDSLDLPESFSFLRRVPGATEVYQEDANSSGTSWLSRAVRNNYTKVTQAQEVMFTAEKFKTDGNVILLLRNSNSEDAGDHLQPRVTRQESITKEAREGSLRTSKSLASTEIQSAEGKQEEQKEEDRTSEEIDAEEYEKVIAGLRDTIKQQAQQIADLQRAMLSMRNSGGTSSSAPHNVSQLETFLMQLQRDAYLEENVIIKELAMEYKQLFAPQDISQWIVSTASNPFTHLVRRNCHSPSHVRDFLEGMQELLYEFKVQKTRLTEAWWSKKLKDPKFLQLSKQEILEWGEGEPWCEDTPERYAYLMTKMTGKEIPKDRLRIISPRPEKVEVEKAETRPPTNSAAVSKTGPRPAPANAALLGSIAGFNKAELNKKHGKKPQNAALLGTIASFNKESLKSGKTSSETNPVIGKAHPHASPPNFLGGIVAFDKSKLKSSPTR